MEFKISIYGMVGVILGALLLILLYIPVIESLLIGNVSLMDMSALEKLGFEYAYIATILLIVGIVTIVLSVLDFFNLPKILTRAPIAYFGICVTALSFFGSVMIAQFLTPELCNPTQILVIIPIIGIAMAIFGCSGLKNESCSDTRRV